MLVSDLSTLFFKYIGALFFLDSLVCLLQFSGTFLFIGGLTFFVKGGLPNSLALLLLDDLAFLVRD